MSAGLAGSDRLMPAFIFPLHKLCHRSTELLVCQHLFKSVLRSGFITLCLLNMYLGGPVVTWSRLESTSKVPHLLGAADWLPVLWNKKGNYSLPKGLQQLCKSNRFKESSASVSWAQGPWSHRGLESGRIQLKQISITAIWPILRKEIIEWW